MPINRKEFETGELAPGLSLELFLRSNHDYGYTVDELVIEMASQRIPLTREEVRNILILLESQGKIKSNTVKGVVHYICEKTMGFRPS